MNGRETPIPPTGELAPEITHGHKLVPPEIIAAQKRVTPQVRESMERILRNQRFLAPKRLKLLKSDLFREGVKSGHITKGWAQDWVLTTYWSFRRPLHVLSQEEWVNYFHMVGLMGDTGLRIGDMGPEEPVKYYRGSSIYFPHGLSWTPYFDIAAGFAESAEDGGVFQIQATPSQIIRSYHARHDHVSEVLIDSRDFFPQLIAEVPFPKV